MINLEVTKFCQSVEVIVGFVIVERQVQNARLRAAKELPKPTLRFVGGAWADVFGVARARGIVFVVVWR